MQSFPHSARRWLPFLGLLTALYILIEKNGFSVLLTCLRPVITSVVIIYLLEPAVNLLTQNLRLPRLAALLIAYALLLLFLGLLIGFLLPDLLQALSQLLDQLPDVSASYLKPLMQHLPELLSGLYSLLLSCTSLLSGIGAFVIALIMAFYFLLSHRSLGEAIASCLYAWLPASLTDRLLSILYLFDRSCRSFVSCKLILAFIQGGGLFLSVWAANLIFHLSIPSPLFMGLLTFLANLVPLLGPVLGLLFCAGLSYLYGFPEMIVVTGLLLLWQQLDNFLLSPRLFSGAADLSPFWILAAVTAATALESFWLLLLAVPLLSFTQALFRAWREKFSNCSLPPQWLRYRP